MRNQKICLTTIACLLLLSIKGYPQETTQPTQLQNTQIPTMQTPPAQQQPGTGVSPGASSQPAPAQSAPPITQDPAGPVPSPVEQQVPPAPASTPPPPPADPSAPPQNSEALNQLQQNAEQPTQPQLTPQDLAKINCEFKPAEGDIPNNVVEAWGKNAAIQAFNFTPSAVDEELTKLQACFTAEGWQSFQDALTQSGNLDAIKKQKFNVTAIPAGNAALNSTGANQWQVIIPMTVTYQNDQDKIQQNLSVELSIGRKATGELGINQIIASPPSTN